MWIVSQGECWEFCSMPKIRKRSRYEAFQVSLYCTVIVSCNWHVCNLHVYRWTDTHMDGCLWYFLILADSIKNDPKLCSVWLGAHQHKCPIIYRLNEYFLLMFVLSRCVCRVTGLLRYFSQRFLGFHANCHIPHPSHGSFLAMYFQSELHWSLVLLHRVGNRNLMQIHLSLFR